MLAASHELEHLSPTAARALLQRGLRLNADSVEMWREYVRMELGFVESLRRRWTVLGIDVKGKGKATETMVDITNAHADDGQVRPRSQSLSYYDAPGADEPRPGQAEQMETFGMPDMLLGSAAPAHATPRRSARSQPGPDEDLPATQSAL